MSLRLRIALLVGAVVTVVVAVVGVRVHDAAETELVEEVDLELVGRAGALVGGLGRGPELEEFTPTNLRGPARDDDRGDGRPSGPFAPRSFFEQSVARDTFARVVDADGEPLITLGADLEADLADEDFPEPRAEPVVSDGTIEGQPARVVTVAVNDVFVQIARPLGEIDQSLDDLRDRIVVIAALAVAVAAAASWWLAGGAVRPIRRLTDAAEAVAATGDLDHPVDGSGGDEVGRLASSFNAMLGALSLSRRQQRQLVMDASHELRTPLASLRTNVDVLRSGREIPYEMRQAIVDDIDAEVGELSDLVAELVELATDVRGDEEPTVVDLVDVVEPVVERQARRTGRTIDLVVLGRAPVEVRADAVSRAVRNLIENAAKFSPAGTPIRVEVDVGRVTVLDSGPGIPPAEREAVFERFHRLEATRTMPGSGLGLAIVKQVAEAHGGRTFVGEAEGGGAAVTMELATIDA